ncbi:MAG: PD40 domain-containing protein [Anaerolineae bacterium]|nr:PD40 domain-containing protein [Anaerolineae bacterium]
MITRRLTNLILITIPLSAVTFACGVQPTSSSLATPTPVESRQFGETTQPLPTATESIIKEVERATPLGYEEPSPDGPWLAFAADNAIWVANADGSRASQITDSAVVATSPVAAPSGGHAAYITASDPLYGGLELWLLSLPSGESKTITALTSPATETGPDADVIMDAPGLEIARAIIEIPSLAWSPDGTMLAFIGAMDGTSADLYVYSLHGGSIRRLTDGPSQGYQPLWSPGGKYILHAGADSFGSGAGYMMAGVWAAQVDSEEVLTLYQPDSSDEIFVEWISNSAFLVYSWSAACGPHNLRTVDVETGEITKIWPGAFFVHGGADVAHDPASGAVLITLDEYSATSSCTADEQDRKPGLYLANINRSGATYFSDLVAYGHVWDEQSRAFLAHTEDGAIQITAQGGVTHLPAPAAATPVVSPDGTSWVWGSSGFAYTPAGLWIGPVGRSAPEQVFEGSVYNAAWSPDSQRVFFFTNSKLYVTDRSGSSLTLLADGIQRVDDVTWVMP